MCAYTVYVCSQFYGLNFMLDNCTGMKFYSMFDRTHVPVHKNIEKLMRY